MANIETKFGDKVNIEGDSKHFRYDVNVDSRFDKEVGCTALWGPGCSRPCGGSRIALDGECERLVTEYPR